MQRSFDDLGQPLAEVTFVVVDLETTGGSPSDCRITEVGAVKFRGGEYLGSFQTLVNPETPIPPQIVYLTGITEAMVGPAPPIDAVLPALAEFIGNAVIVGHNVRFDLGFLRANLRRLGYRALTNPFVDTCSLARRLIREEVANCKLATLARHFRTAAEPCHRALDDAKATAEVFHALVERAAGLGVLALDDLLALPTTAAHPQASKLRWVAALPRKPGVYLFRDGRGEVLYVGRATDLRRRVRSYFAGDDRRKIAGLLREAQGLDHVVCAHDLEAAVLEVRLIHQHLPRYNRQVKAWRRYAYLKLTLGEPFPRLAVVRVARSGDGALYLGPLPSSAAAKLVAEAVESVVPLRRCAARPPAQARPAPCTPAQLGVASCPCAGAVTEDAYRVLVGRAVRGLTDEPRLLLDALAERMASLAAAQRFEEAAVTRERAAALARAVARQRRLHAVVQAGRMVVELGGGGGAIIDCGRLTASWAPDEPPVPDCLVAGGERPTIPLARDAVDEVAAVASWLDAAADTLRLLHCDAGLCHPSSTVATFAPQSRRPAA
ncbi:MAG: DEDD exonuclease domain-containing protein [Actinobacteria bacterium]|nr:DEDD exonuclease domain-containing protein [Actinomycetota bacterium]